jgi:hypothetical protein
MKGFGTFDTTNTLYGSFYSREQDPVTNIPKYSKPNMEEQFYDRTIEMQKGYFNRYAHLYKDPTGKPIYNPIDGKAFKEEDAQRPLVGQQQPMQGGEEQVNTLNQRTSGLSSESPEKETSDEPVMRTFHRNFEAEKQ